MTKLLKTISVRLPDELLEKIDRRCKEASMSRSLLFRTALEERIETESKSEGSEQKINGFV